MGDLKSWVINQNFDFIAQAIDSESLIYHCGSGATHWLDTEAGFVFGLLWNNQASMTSESLITQAQQNNFNQLDLHSLETILNRLSAIHLVKSS